MSPAVIDRVLSGRDSSLALDRKVILDPAHAVAYALSQTARTERSRTTPGRASSGWPWKRFVLPTATALAVVLGVAIVQSATSPHSEPGAATHQHQNAAQIVNIDRPSPATTATVLLPATIRPWQTATLHSRVTGYLAAWHVDLGASVKAGDVLAELETPELDQEVAEGESLASEAVAAAVQAEAERTEAEAQLSVSLAQLARAKAEVELSRSHLARRERLLASGAVSADEHETYRKEWEARTADVTAAESDIAHHQANLKTRAAIIQAREATAKSRQANVERLKELQSFQRIVAPFDGVVTQRTAEVGMLVTTGMEPLFVIQDMARVRVQVNVPQANSFQVHAGIEATVSAPESAVQVRGSVTRLSGSVDSTNRTMLAEIELDNASRRFQPGSYAQVTLATPQKDTAWTIPANTLQMRVEGPHVAVVGNDNRVELKRVTLGRNLGKRITVTEGIYGDERLIVNPSDTLASGSTVEVNNQAIAQR